MKNGKPLIIVTANYDYEKSLSYIKNLYCEALVEAGAAPVLLPLSMNQEVIEAYVDKCNGLMVVGGPDVDPVYYGENNMPYNGELSPYRDVMEIALVKKAVLSNTPVFGICRGIQVLNVAMGGTLYQDLHQQIKEREIIKHAQSAPRWHNTHQVVIKKDTFMWEVYNTEKVPVNSFHHQAVKDIAPDFEPTAWSEDGIVEAIEYSKDSFAVGVQWHPEDLWQQQDLHRELFKQFVKMCSINMQ